MEEKPNSEHFHGFQMIKAVDKRDRFINGLASPKFATYVENMMKYASKKLEKVLSYDHKTSSQVEDNRTTLSELFQKTKTVDEKTGTKCDIGKSNEKKTRSATYSASADEKPHKILQMIHLEALAIAQNMRKYVKKSNVKEGYKNRHNIIPEDTIIFSYESVPANRTKGKVLDPTYAGTEGKRERWIKSDAEYLILEL